MLILRNLPMDIIELFGMYVTQVLLADTRVRFGRGKKHFCKIFDKLVANCSTV